MVMYYEKLLGGGGGPVKHNNIQHEKMLCWLWLMEVVVQPHLASSMFSTTDVL